MRITYTPFGVTDYNGYQDMGEVTYYRSDGLRSWRIPDDELTEDERSVSADTGLRQSGVSWTQF